MFDTILLWTASKEELLKLVLSTRLHLYQYAKFDLD